MSKLLASTRFSRPALCQRRTEIRAELASAFRQFYERDLPSAEAALAAAKEAACWPENQWPTPDMAAANIAAVRLRRAYEAKRSVLESELDEVEAALRAETDDLVADLLRELVDDEATTRKKLVSVRLSSDVHPLTGARRDSMWSNSRSITDRLAAISKLRTHADHELRYVEKVADLRGELARLRAALPLVEAAPKEAARG